MTLNRALTIDRWRRYMVMVLDVAIGQCERRSLTAPVSMGASDLRPPDLVMALIEELQVTHNFEVRFPRNNQHALDMLFALQHFYLAYADVDDAAREALGVSAAGTVACQAPASSSGRRSS